MLIQPGSELYVVRGKNLGMPTGEHGVLWVLILTVQLTAFFILLILFSVPRCILESVETCNLAKIR